MSGLLSDFLPVHADLLAAELARPFAELGLADQEPKQFLNAMLVALSADDLRPLAALFNLDQPKPQDVDNHLEVALRAIEALERTVHHVSGKVLAPAPAGELCVETGSDLLVVSRRLATVTTSTMGKHLLMLGAGSGRGTSLSITMHELRRPLTILNSYAQLLAAGMLGELPESAQIAIDGITT